MNTLTRKPIYWLALVVLGHGVMSATNIVGTAALAQDKPLGYPVRPIRIVISVAPGAGADMVARHTAQILTERWGQNVVVDPRPGGGGVVASELLSKSTPDGYTILQSGDGLLFQTATKRVPYDVLKAFEPIVSSTQQPYILLANLSVPAKTVKELIALSAGKPLTYAGSAGIGGTVHLGMEKLGKMSGLKLKHVAYKGSAPALMALMALMGGEVNLGVTSVMSATSVIRGGKVRGIAALGLKRASSLPELPTIGEQGITGIKITNRYNLWVRAGTPRPIIHAINRAVSEGINTPQMIQKLAADGSEPAERMTPEQLKAELARLYVELEKQVQELGLKF
jgi:tripartite-type tricarboxylate transporter receptor subunit TctC